MRLKIEKQRTELTKPWLRCGSNPEFFRSGEDRDRFQESRPKRPGSTDCAELRYSWRRKAERKSQTSETPEIETGKSFGNCSESLPASARPDRSDPRRWPRGVVYRRKLCG